MNLTKKKTFNKHEFKSLLHLILRISDNHYRGTNFFNKIEKILLFFKDDIKNKMSNSEIFQIFKSNKRILLFLIEEKIMILDEIIAESFLQTKFNKAKYFEYFLPEIKPLLNEKFISKHRLSTKKIEEELPENYYIDRKIGENNNNICKLIQKDMIKDFILFINKNDYSLNATIEPSIYETNHFLLKNPKISLIEYAAFFGSRHIFKYLAVNDATLNPSIWFYAIHGNDAEIIDYLKQNEISPIKDSYYEVFIESIICHHNDFATYLLNNYLQDENENENKNVYHIRASIKSYNFTFLQNIFDYPQLFYFLCKYDHFILVNKFLKMKDIDINQIII